MSEKMLWVILLFVSFRLTSAELVRDGVGQSVIILNEQPTKSACFAAHELQFHLEALTGAKIPIARSGDGFKTRIHVGGNPGISDKVSFQPQEYLVLVRGNDIYLTGCDSEDFGPFQYENHNTFPDIWSLTGSCYAVYDFLELLGIRWYLPGSLGITFTPVKTLEISDVSCRRIPFFHYRRQYQTVYAADLAADTLKSSNPQYLNARDTKLWLLRTRLGGTRMDVSHSFYSFYKRFPEKKEWFAKGYNGQPPQLCFSNPELLEQVIKDARDYFDGRLDPKVAGLEAKGLDYYPIFPNDNTLWCKCPECQKQILKDAVRGKGEYSNDIAGNYIFDFVSKISHAIRESHPGKYIAAAAYSQFCYPPDNLKLPENIRITLCLHGRMVYSSEKSRNDDRILQAWKEAAPELTKIVWMYYCFPMLSGLQQKNRLFPGFFASHVKDYFRKYEGANVRGMFMEPSYGADSQCMVLMDQLEGYLNWKLAWNRDLDPDAMFNEFFQLYYGPAGEAMKAFYLIVQDRYCDSKNWPSEGHMNEAIAWGSLGTEKIMESLQKEMDSAKKAAIAEPYRARVALFEKGVWDYMRQGRKTYVGRSAQMSGSMMQSDVPFVDCSRPGDSESISWPKIPTLHLFGGLKAEPLKQQLEVKAAHDGEYLYLAYTQRGILTSQLVTNTALWQNDNWETHFAKQRAIPYQMFAADSIGNITGVQFFGTVSQEWSPFPGKVMNMKKEDSWTMLISIPLKEVVPEGIKPGEMLYFNVLRTANNQASGCWIPTFAGFHAPDRFGELYLMPKK